MGTTAQAQAGRERARESRLKAARERRIRLDPDHLAREQRLDEAAVDVEVAWEKRAEAEQAVTAAEIAAAAAIERLLAERLAVKDVVQLTGLDPATVRRLRQLVEADSNDGFGTPLRAATPGGVLAGQPTIVTGCRRQNKVAGSPNPVAPSAGGVGP